MDRKKVVVILGQTATGKSNLAVRLAKKINGEVISADSRQVYKKLNIGTGKITKKEMHGVPHHMLDVASLRRSTRQGGKFNVIEYKKLVDKKISEIIKRGNVPIICGGTGFYIDAVVKGITFPEVLPNPKLRKKLASLSNETLMKKLQRLDRIHARNIDPKNKQRIIRAIEIAKALGKVPKPTEATPPYEFIKIGLYLSLDKLEKKVEKRVKEMFKKGLLKEIEGLKKAGVSKQRLQELGFEYFNPTEEKVTTETLKYAKRQMTWFKRDRQIKWLDASDTKNLTKQMRELELQIKNT